MLWEWQIVLKSESLFSPHLLPFPQEGFSVTWADRALCVLLSVLHLHCEGSDYDLQPQPSPEWLVNEVYKQRCYDWHMFAVILWESAGCHELLALFIYWCLYQDLKEEKKMHRWECELLFWCDYKTSFCVNYLRVQEMNLDLFRCVTRRQRWSGW